MFTDSKKHLPFPEAIDRDDVPDRFTITAGNESRTDLTHGVMVVNGGDVCEECGKDHARATRLHEMGHVAWTPADWQRRTERAKDAPPVMLVNAAEDARLTRLRAVNGLTASPPILCQKTGEHRSLVMNTIRSGNLLALAGILCAASGSQDEAPFSEVLREVITTMNEKEQYDEAQAVMQIAELVRWSVGDRLWSKSKPTFRSSLSVARDLMESVASVEEKYLEAKDIKEAKKKTVVKKPRRMLPDSTWGEMNVVEVPLTHLSSLGMERRWTARDEGPIPTRFDRWSIDKRVFRTKKRTKGAAILVDCSGSMKWNDEDLSRVLEEVPAATVAIYSGNGKEGNLVIVARKGRRAKWSVVKPYRKGGNVIDGPALAWLASQPESVKVWMSDGGITGPNDAHSNAEHMERMERDVKKHLRRGGIMRVRDAENVMKVLSGRRKFVPDRDFENPWRR